LHVLHILVYISIAISYASCFDACIVAVILLTVWASPTHWPLRPAWSCSAHLRYFITGPGPDHMTEWCF